MARLDALADDLRHVATLLAEDVLEPDPSRTDWKGLRVRVGMVREGLQRLLDALPGALEEAEEAPLQARIRERVAQLTSRTAALLFTSGQPEEARGVMERAVALAHEPSQRALLEAGLAEPEAFRDYVHGLWLNGRERKPQAAQVLRRVARTSHHKALQQAARGGIQEAPSMEPAPRTWHKLVLATCAGALVWAGVVQYRASPGHLARVALGEAQAAEATLPREQALERYRSVIEQHKNGSVQAQAAQAVVRLSLAGLPSPCTRDSVEAVQRVVNGVESLPSESYQGEPAARLGERLEACSRELGQATPEDTHAALEVVRAALRVTSRPAQLQTRRVELQRAVADGLVQSWPLRALALYVELPGKESLDAARGVLDTLGEAPSLWLEAADSVEAWLKHPDQEPSQSPTVTRYRERLAAARATHTRDAALLETEEEARLLQASQAQPDNQELAVAVASRMRNRGEVAEALERLKALGPEGRLTGEARMLRGLCHRELGQLAEADVVLSSFVSESLAPFLRAQQRYDLAERTLERQLIAQAEQENPPRQLEEQLRDASSTEDAQRILHEWLAHRMESDPALERLRQAFLRQQPVVPATLVLGTVKLERANAAEGEARRVLLSEAERLFLSIQQQAEGDPRVHLGLGQVYHRLGRVEEGDRELRGLLERKEPRLTLEVAHLYRELDRIDQARPLGEQVYATAPDDDLKYEAAALMARLATDEEEEEQWLLRGDPHSATVQNDLLSARAQRALREGRLEEADRAEARVAAFRSLEARHNATAANNTSIALMTRYEATGDVEHLRSSVQYLETALRLVPDNALVMGNLADALQYLGAIQVLEHWVRTRPLHLDSPQAQQVLDMLLDSPLREDVLRAMAAEPALRRSQELSQQEQTLAPAKSSAWERQLRWLQQHRDTHGLETLTRRLEPLPPFTGSTEAEDRRRRESGAMDTQLGKWAAQRVAWSEAMLKHAEQAHHAPTLAVAWSLLGEARRARRVYEPSPNTLEALGEAYRQAARLWPALGSSLAVTRGLTQVALERGAARSEVLARVWKAEGREQGATVVLHHALSGPEASQVAAVLRAQPELQEAATHVRERVRTAPDMSDWVLARAEGDGVLERAAAAVFARPDVELALALDTKLAGGHAREQAEQSLFQQGKALQSRP